MSYLRYYSNDNRPRELTPQFQPRRNQHPPPNIRHELQKETTHEDFFNLPSGFSKADIRTMAQRESDWATENLPFDIRAGGHLRLYVWSERRPTPATHLEQSYIRLPILRKVTKIRQFFLSYARSEYEESEIGKCPICASQLLGYPMADHGIVNCPFAELKGEDRIRFIAINLVSFCHFCNARTGVHTSCTRPGCKSCKSLGHTKASGLCGHRLYGLNTRESDANLEKYVRNIRRESYMHIQRLLKQEPPVLLYRSHVDAPYALISKRNPHNATVIGLGTYQDVDKEFSFPYICQYGNYRKGRRADYRGIVPPEFYDKARSPLPVFADELLEYYEAIGDCITDLKTGRTTLNELELPRFPYPHNGYAFGEDREMGPTAPIPATPTQPPAQDYEESDTFETIGPGPFEGQMDTYEYIERELPASWAVMMEQEQFAPTTQHPPQAEINTGLIPAENNNSGAESFKRTVNPNVPSTAQTTTTDPFDTSYL